MYKRISCVLLAIMMIILMSSCSGHGTELTEENVTYTVEQAVGALQDFNLKKLDKYVESGTLSYIVSYAKKHDQFTKLGKAIFANLSVEIKSINIADKTVIVTVKNKDLTQAATDFTKQLLSQYTALQLMSRLSDDAWLDSNLSLLTNSIDKAEMSAGSVDVTLYITQKSNNLALSFDEAAEDAVSGGALKAIKDIA